MNLTEARAEIERLTTLNHSLATRLVGMSDTLQASARQIAANAWDQAVAAMRYPDGTPVELMTNNNPYRQPIETLGSES